MTKAELRREFLVRRNALSTKEVKRRSQLIAWRFFDFWKQADLVSGLTIVHTFLPIQRQKEIDTWPIIRALWAKHLPVFVPVTDVLQPILHHDRLTPQTPLVENRWGIPEPTYDSQLAQQPTHFDLILVPLLSFSQRGDRVGYGKGFYDRFLAECRPDCLKIGLSLFEPTDYISDVEQTDVRLDHCITPTQVYDFK